jgi:hypothetical protein
MPNSIILLCRDCRLEKPNVFDKNLTWDWLKAAKKHSRTLGTYNTYWFGRGLDEYKNIYGTEIMDDIASLGIETKDFFDKYSEKLINETTKPLNLSTRAVILKKVIDDYRVEIKSKQTLSFI